MREREREKERERKMLSGIVGERGDYIFATSDVIFM